MNPKHDEERLSIERAFNVDDFRQGSLTYDDYAVMGLVSAQFSHLDLGWSFLIWSLLAQCDVITTHCDDARGQFQRTGMAVTATMSFRRKIDLAVALAVERFGGTDSRVTAIQKIARECASLEDQRNTMIHSWWSAARTPKNDGNLARATRTKYALHRKKGLITSSDKGVNRESLIELAERMDAVFEDLTDARLQMYPS